ncbi:hypothetical protein Areg01_40830 [Actinoplanes regularis]|nr:hypothetical protein Areg01_40830 [Actinoplanes regularis]
MPTVVQARTGQVDFEVPADTRIRAVCRARIAGDDFAGVLAQGVTEMRHGAAGRTSTKWDANHRGGPSAKLKRDLATGYGDLSDHMRQTIPR